MRGRHSCFRIQMDLPTHVTLQGWLHRQKTPNGLARRARAMLLLEQGQTYLHTASQVGLAESHVRKGARRFREQGIPGLFEKPRPGRVPIFSPEVALHIVKVACERPDQVGCSLSRWDCPELARKLQADGVAQSISPATIRRIIRSQKLKPWQQHLWLSAKVPRDEGFAQLVRTLIDLYIRPLAQNELVLCG